MSNLNDRQFAAHIIATHAPIDRLPKDKSDEDVWARKLERTKSTAPERRMVVAEGDGYRQVTMHEHIGIKGVSKPVTLQHPDAVAPGAQPRVFDGHHRLASAAEHGLDVPIRYAKDMDEARALDGRFGRPRR